MSKNEEGVKTYCIDRNERIVDVARPVTSQRRESVYCLQIMKERRFLTGSGQ